MLLKSTSGIAAGQACYHPLCRYPAYSASHSARDGQQSENRCRFLSAWFSSDDPTGYGRIMLSDTGTVEAIIEHKDATDSQKEITLVNGGAMAAKAGVWFTFFRKLRRKTAKMNFI